MPPNPTKKLTLEKALIFRILHRENVAFVLENGLHCGNSEFADPEYIRIGNVDLIEKRQTREVPIDPGGVLSDYVPFYFTPFSPMLLNIRTGWGNVVHRNNEDIVIVVSSLHRLVELGIPFVFTDRHAYLLAANYYSDLSKLSAVDFELLRTKDFSSDPEDPGKMERYQAEALIHQSMPAEAFLGVLCYNDKTRESIEAPLRSLGSELIVEANPNWYF